MTQHTNHRSHTLLVLTFAGAIAVLAACGGGSPKATSTSTPATSAAANANTGRGAFGTPPAASGQIAEIDGSTLQVQSQTSGQVAVTVTSKTTYTQTEAATLADVKVGSCIVATAPSSTSSTSSSSPSAQPRTAITATAVVVTQAAQGSCTRGGFGGPRGTSVPTTRPSDFPSGRPSGARQVNLVAAAGQVTAVHGSAITVTAERRTAASNSSTTYTATVTVTSATTYTQTVPANQSALKVGLCMTAAGTTGSDGTVTATRVALSPPTANGCETGFRRGGFGAAGGSGGPGGPGGTVTGGS